MPGDEDSAAVAAAVGAAAEQVASDDAAVAAAYADEVDGKPAEESKPEVEKPAEEIKPVEEAKPVEVKPDEEKPVEAKPTEEKPAADAIGKDAWGSYWTKVQEVFPKAVADSSSPLFQQFLTTLDPKDVAAANDAANPQAAVKLMAKFYEARASGAIKPDAEKPVEAITADEGSLKRMGFALDRKFRKPDGSETTLTDWMKADPLNQEAVGAMVALMEERIPAYIQQLVKSGVFATSDQADQLAAQLNQRFAESDLQAKVGDKGDVRTISKTPEFVEFLKTHRLERMAWENGAVEDKADVVERFQAGKVKAIVDTAKATQTAVKGKKDDLAKGAIPGQFKREAATPGAADTALAEEKAYDATDKELGL